MITKLLIRLRKYIRIDSPFKVDYSYKEQLFFGGAIFICIALLITIGIF